MRKVPAATNTREMSQGSIKDDRQERVFSFPATPQDTAAQGVPVLFKTSVFPRKDSEAKLLCFEEEIDHRELICAKLRLLNQSAVSLRPFH